jgi:hypothetical protein
MWRFFIFCWKLDGYFFFFFFNERIVHHSILSSNKGIMHTPSEVTIVENKSHTPKGNVYCTLLIANIANQEKLYSLISWIIVHQNSRMCTLWPISAITRVSRLYTTRKSASTSTSWHAVTLILLLLLLESYSNNTSKQLQCTVTVHCAQWLCKKSFFELTWK